MRNQGGREERNHIVIIIVPGQNLLLEIDRNNWQLYYLAGGDACYLVGRYMKMCDWLHIRTDAFCRNENVSSFKIADIELPWISLVQNKYSEHLKYRVADIVVHEYVRINTQIQCIPILCLVFWSSFCIFFS